MQQSWLHRTSAASPSDLARCHNTWRCTRSQPSAVLGNGMRPSLLSSLPLPVKGARTFSPQRLSQCDSKHPQATSYRLQLFSIVFRGHRLRTERQSTEAHCWLVLAHESCWAANIYTKRILRRISNESADWVQPTYVFFGVAGS